MEQLLRDFFAEVGPMLGEAAITWAVAGLLLGGILGLVLGLGFDRAGWLGAGRHRRTVLLISLAWLVSATGLLGLAAGFFTGVSAVAEQVLHQSTLVREEMIPPGERFGVGVIAVMTEAQRPELPLPDDAPTKFASGSYEVDAEALRRAGEGLIADLDGPGGPERAKALIEPAAARMPNPQQEDTVGIGIVLSSLAARHDALDQNVRSAWDALPEAARASGDPDKVDARELSTWAVHHVVVPTAVAPLVSVTLTVWVVVLFAVPVVWALPLLLGWFVRRKQD